MNKVWLFISTFLFYTLLGWYSLHAKEISQSIEWKRGESINWNNTRMSTSTFEGALYTLPEGPWPVLRVYLGEGAISEVSVKNSGWQNLSPSDSSLYSHYTFPEFQFKTKTFTERGKTRNYLEIIPLEQLSANEYRLVTQLEIQYNINKTPSTFSNARTSLAGSSVLASGTWYKIAITTEGVHMLNRNFFNENNIDISGIDPRTIRIFGNGGKMLPQSNAVTRPDGLQENAIVVRGEGDGAFNDDDYVLFYAMDVNTHYFDKESGFVYENNTYADTSYYFLNFGGEEGLRVQEKAPLPGEFSHITIADTYYTFEEDIVNIMNETGREWYGERFRPDDPLTLTVPLMDPVANSPVILTTNVLGQTRGASKLNVLVNNNSVGTYDLVAIPNGIYTSNGEEFLLKDTINVGSASELKVRFELSSQANEARARLNYISVVYSQKLQYTGSQRSFLSLASSQNPTNTYSIASTSSPIIWDITNPTTPAQVMYSKEGGTVKFNALSDSLRTFVMFEPVNAFIPHSIRKIDQQDLHGQPAPDLIVITNKEFLSEAARFSAYRSAASGIDILVVTQDQIFNEFSSGTPDPTAIRDFARYMYLKGEQQKLKHLLLLGRTSFDYKDRVNHNTNFVLTYSSRNSTHPLKSYSSDDYFAFLDEDEGTWDESASGDHWMDIGVGRLPAKSSGEAAIMIDKIIHYETNPDRFGSWRNEVLFLADDGDANIHVQDADRLANFIDTTYRQLTINKVYLDDYTQVKQANAVFSPETSDALQRGIEKGALIVNYSGHGSESRLAEETILDLVDIRGMDNKNRLSFFVTATCQFGRFDNPNIISGAEELLLNPNGGAIGVLSSSRAVYSNTNYLMNKAFYKYLTDPETGEWEDVGTIYKNTKNNSLNGTINRNYILMADPSMKLGTPQYNIQLITNEAQEVDTLGALTLQTIEGKITDALGNPLENFDGELELTIYDKPIRNTTLGDESNPFQYNAWSNSMHRGTASVNKGTFELSFITPKNIDYTLGQGKIFAYARSSNLSTDATGANMDIMVGGPSSPAFSDNIGPDIRVYINDTTFVNGGITDPTPILLLKLYDESGINILSGQPGNDLVVTIDGEKEYILNEFYKTDKDTYKQGTVLYSLGELTPGKHTLKVKAWDVFNNSSEKSIDFQVIEGEQIQINSSSCVPNPVRESSVFSFTHNRSGDDLEVWLSVYNSQGRQVLLRKYDIQSSQGMVELPTWDGRNNGGSLLINGVYIYNIIVQSTTNGSKSSISNKLVLIN